jgi:hypothetical protein
MTQVLWPVLAVAFIAAIVVAVAVIVRKMSRGPRLSTLFANKPAKRIDIVEQAVIDGKRRLLLVRRDGVEHLLMTGGPVDIVIESGIDATRAAGQSPTSSLSPARPPRHLGEAAE